MRFQKINGTFGVVIKKKIYFIQFSLKEPWLIPRHEQHYKPEVLDANMYGWLFFYFGTMPILLKEV